MLVTAGALHAFTLLLRVLAGPGDRVLTEHPTYAAALDAVRAVGARPVPVPMLADGWDLEMLAATLRQAAPRLAYVIPDHQNPTGLTMPAADRERLVALARTTRTPLVSTRRSPACTSTASPPPPVAALDPDGETVITIGSMSKAFWAGLRIGWIRANPALVRSASPPPAPRWTSAARCSSSSIAVELLADADAVLERQRAAARARRDASSPRCARTSGVALPRCRAGGLSLWVELDAPRSTALAAIADRYGAAPRRRPALRRRRRLRALHPAAVLPPGAGSRGRRRPARRRLARRHRVRRPSPSSRAPRWSPESPSR